MHIQVRTLSALAVIAFIGGLTVLPSSGAAAQFQQQASWDIPARAEEAFSASRRRARDLKRQARRPALHHVPRNVGRVGDPSIGPDGRPYRVPENLRGGCFIDEGYGRFSACVDR